jgi:Mycotoxin biosynthesis protein UstYa
MMNHQQQQQHDIPHRLSSDDSSSSIDSHLLEKEINSIRQREPFWRRNYIAFLVHTAILFIYLISVSLLLAENWRLQALVRPNLLKSPANEAVHWEVKEWHAGDGLHEPYVGEPRPELEEAWEGLLGSTLFTTASYIALVSGLSRF